MGIPATERWTVIRRRTARTGRVVIGDIEEHSSVDGTTGFHKAGNGLMVVDRLKEIHGPPALAGASFRAARIVGLFDPTDKMPTVYARYKGHPARTADESGWRPDK